MSVLIVGSTNPDLSYVLQKNPQTIKDTKKPYTKPIRKGCAYGFYTKNSQEFRLWFRDSDMESSFASGVHAEFEYLDTSRYGSPYLPISLITNCLSTAAKKVDEHDVAGYEAYVTTTLKVANNHYQEQIVRHYEGIAKIESRHISGKFYEITVRTPTVNQALNVMQVVCLLQCLSDAETYIELKEDALQKYINCLNAADAPYFIRYLFSMRAFSNRQSFAKLRPGLELQGMSLKYGNTQQQRFDAIHDIFTGGETLLDLGCGEMFYSFKLVNKYDTIFTVDQDVEQQEINRQKLEKRQTENTVTLTETITPEWIATNADMFDDADVLFVEVMEHMPLEQATAIVQALLKTNYRRLIVTTPNKDFNVNYGFTGDQIRHADHDFEMTYQEFSDWATKLWKDSKPGLAAIQGIGDSVNGSSVTSMAVFTRKVDTTGELLSEIAPVAVSETVV